MRQGDEVNEEIREEIFLKTLRQMKMETQNPKPMEHRKRGKFMVKQTSLEKQERILPKVIRKITNT